MLIIAQKENSTDPLVDSFSGIPSDFVGWSDPLSNLFSWVNQAFNQRAPQPTCRDADCGAFGLKSLVQFIQPR